ncbi:hypothetical protein J3R30DRAFT_3699726 [Lentinula aciculospora]|uniref:F-box domain-containing protein n=1 Tax=Lentinula aciculospora TaxID=153920 RepID=A0A9W9AGK8_9AGAR|nr:hypothetical protein J3R30DRAFT_3699726 [Lentinula aciculospora]
MCRIGDLPVEILGLIFLQVHSRTLSSSTTKFTTSDVVVTLSLVSSLWRETCISISSLWSHIHIVKTSSNEVERLQMFLERSGSCPLTIEFHAGADAVPYTADAGRMIWKLFGASARWKKALFSVQAPFLEVIAMVLSGESGSLQLAQRFEFPLLEKLSFTRHLDNQSRHFVNIFQPKVTPRLHILVIPSYTALLPFAFGQITSLNLFKTNKALPDLSVLCPQLVTLKIGQTFGDPNEATPPHAFELLKVETLTVSCSGPGRLWSMLTLPSLRNLTLEAITFMRLEYVAFINMLRRSGCGQSLRKLTLSGMDMRDVEVQSMFDLMPQLRELVVRETLTRQGKTLTASLLTALKSTSRDLAIIYPFAPSINHLIPDLAYIELHIDYNPNFRLDILFDMLSARAIISNDSSSALRWIHLCFILDQNSPPSRVPLELEGMVNKLRLVSTSHIHSTVQCGQEWRREF